MTNEDLVWLEQLRSSESFIRDQAILRLREILLRGLSKSLTDRYGQPFSVEDVVQDALIKILSSLDQFEGRSRFTTWAMTVATRIGISSLRRKYHQDVSMEVFRGEENGYVIEIPLAVDDANAHDRSELLATLQELINNELTEKQRLAVLAFLSGFSTDGIAQRMGTNRNAVYKLIYDARIKLKQGFENSGVSADDVWTAFA